MTSSDGALRLTERNLLGAADAERFDRLLGVLSSQLRTLDDKPEETPASALRALWLLVLGTPASAHAAATMPLAPLSEHQANQLDIEIGRRLAGHPLAYLTGRQNFMGIELLVGAEALIPRRETELLGRAALERLAIAAQEHNDASLLDVCTGCGNIAVALAHHVPTARVFAADLSHAAVSLARCNAEHVGVASRVEVRVGDLLAPYDSVEFYGRVDVLSCNPPYISSGKVPSMAAEIAEHEPALAFDGGPFGVRILTRLVQDAPRFLKIGGWLALEVGAGQGPAVARRLLATKRFSSVLPVVDSQDVIRAICARRVA